MKTLAYVLAAWGIVLATADAVDYYVNDDSAAGDVYCTAVGNDANDGTAPATPKATIQRILDVYALTAGDRVWVDTGTYYPTNANQEGPGIQFLRADQGLPGAPMVLQGSTNYIAGGSLFVRQSDDYPALNVYSTMWVTVRDLRISGGMHGLQARTSSNILFESCEFFGNKSDGALIRAVSNIVFRNCRFHGNGGDGLQFYEGSTRLYLEHCSIWNNHHTTTGSIYNLPELNYDQYGAEIFSMSNTIVLARGPGHRVMHVDNFEVYPYAGDYNNLVALDGAVFIGVGLSAYPTLESWQAKTTQDLHSISRDPELTADGHLKSRAGTWSNGTWAIHATNSPCIDAGRPASPFSDEPAPNGGRVNIGAFGNTGQASKTADHDGDGLSDNSECYEYGTNPDSDDTDGDGYDDRSELIAGTTATNEESFFSAHGVMRTNTTARGFELAWYGVSGRIYQPQWRTNLVSGASWSNCTGLVTPSGQAVSLNGANASVTAVDTNADGKTVRFYRVRVTRP